MIAAELAEHTDFVSGIEDLLPPSAPRATAAVQLDGLLAPIQVAVRLSQVEHRPGILRVALELFGQQCHVSLELRGAGSPIMVMVNQNPVELLRPVAAVGGDVLMRRAHEPPPAIAAHQTLDPVLGILRVLE